MVSKTRSLLFLAASIVIGAIAFLMVHKHQINQSLETYQYDHVLSQVTKPKNIPLVEELYRLGREVAAVKDLKSKDISDPRQRKAHILLSKICKDSCLPIRCRLDPGLGHACRINCPVRKVKFCVTSLKPLASPSSTSK